jgi:hypothetical protein
MKYAGRMVLGRTDFSEECSASIIRITRIGKLETKKQQATTAGCKEILCDIVFPCPIPEDKILHSHHRETTIIT